MIWDIALRKVLRHAATSFALDVRFASDAPRLVLFGPSGAGKTLTLKTIAGIVRPDAARICVAGRVLHDSARGLRLSPQQRQLGFVFQDYALFPHLTVRQNIAFGRRTGWFNPGRARTDEAVERWIAAFHLEGVVDHRPHQLSGGQRQRTALARALVNEPSALLLDEPFAALDMGLRQRLRSELAELQAQLGLPLLLITHDLDDVRALDAQVVHLQRGRVVEDSAVPDACHAQA
ncbi:MAG: ATP-binding cassette domain-containing protein [Burkholderiaceae bacterium]|nr:ATP-binding cassette domain-containing protein [Burkholderiaceae bacterium]MEB2351938.1 ATP-binding cassette domain-containing protein [Burkholderiaceae bacterium]